MCSPSFSNEGELVLRAFTDADATDEDVTATIRAPVEKCIRSNTRHGLRITFVLPGVEHLTYARLYKLYMSPGSVLDSAGNAWAYVFSNSELERIFLLVIVS